MLGVLQAGVPGLTELLIILLVLAVPLVVAVGLVMLLLRWRSGEDGTDERVAQLEREVDQLRDQLRGGSGRPSDDSRGPDDAGDRD